MSQSTDFPRTLLPGFGRPLKYFPRKDDPDFMGKPFPTALSPQNIRPGVFTSGEALTLPMTTLRELTMLQLMNNITDKPEWQIKINGSEITQKWKDEALTSGRDITNKMVDWCIDELRYKASLILPPAVAPPIFVYNGDVVKSDVAVSTELKKELQDAINKFEKKVSTRMKDWHPNSDEKVWNLVHPSLFPLVYGRTRVLKNSETVTLDDCIQRCGQGEVAPIPSDKGANEDTDTTFPDGVTRMQGLFSVKFQWLPCEVDISGQDARITSYINSLHPQEQPHLYKILEKLISASIPLWDLTLAPLRDEQYFKQLKLKRRIPCDRVLYDPNRRVVMPEPQDSFAPLETPAKFSLKEVYGNRGLQVIVKLANIELTPEKPEYNGGTWHVEGQMNEHIVATSLYYYSCQNITTSNLSFRQQCSGGRGLEIHYPQYHYDWLPLVFGLDQSRPAVQEIGSVETREGRLLTFPNILQHRVGPFELADPTKPGHRKIVALFLVDPNIKIISTANVPCQRQDWWLDMLSETPGSSSSSAGTKQAGLAGLPLELQEQILEDVDFPISLQEAKELRLELMEERKEFVMDSNQYFESAVFGLCEH